MTLESIGAAVRHPGLAAGRVDIEDLHMLFCPFPRLPRLSVGIAAVATR